MLFISITPVRVTPLQEQQTTENANRTTFYFWYFFHNSIGEQGIGRPPPPPHPWGVRFGLGRSRARPEEARSFEALDLTPSALVWGANGALAKQNRNKPQTGGKQMSCTNQADNMSGRWAPCSVVGCGYCDPFAAVLTSWDDTISLSGLNIACEDDDCEPMQFVYVQAE